MEILIAFIAFSLLAFIISVLLYFIFGRIVEPTYIFLFNKPVYVHFYPFPKELSFSEKAVLEKNFRFYRNLSEQRKKYFRHRIHAFIDNYKFVGRGGLEVTEEMKVKIAATAIMLTFGMREYLPDLFEVIIVYPDVFESANGDYHKGEFNPAAGAIVFSWRDFQEGIEFDNSNINLGLHEFGHVLHVNAMGIKRLGSAFVIYSDMFTSIKQYVAVPYNRDKILNAGYLRDYAFTNEHEFIAVALEYFFESPQEFRQRLPELYEMIKKMINYREN
ncbi:zinc-dependent peptidase [Flavobacterium suzhouense]|uniref:Zinc-dependent peptidase n=1 Tax=Flavobacterium suzhouense TaxID=1529638 RepID=A0ABW5NS80_9FLAO